ncbi:LacI family DNA-binding transcriptional regulator [Kordia sp. YSTF-M3]|uniref:LacI family DNA-binding transcriptional regulator n=1 Tax=Kordia aestuariivivens TaxID=2759037 RepID=A0ABR7QCX0_9FLAO|nr:LacI family DNA-binding transcriptional regulator [Kordia aestuariivivens]MBC8756395.1 LacI family DNA-binding transcriptional regulator [Kordia aestuariivivens]
MKNVVSLKSLAKELNISVSTVSKSLNDSEEISAQTKERVKNLAKLRGYSPNPIAVRLQKQETMQIGVIIPNIENPFFASVLKGIDEIVSTSKYNIITFFSNESLEKEKECLDHFSRGNVDGILICIAEETNKKKTFDHIIDIKQKGIPLVLFDRIPMQPLGFDVVHVNDYDSIVSAYEYLEEKKCKNIAFVSSIPTLIVGRLREDGYLSKAKNPIVIAYEELSELQLTLQESLKEGKIDGLISADINATLLCNSAIQKQGLTYSNEISLIGYVNAAQNELSYPKITSIDQHPEEIGRQTAKALLLRLESKLENVPVNDIVLNTTITIGETSV